MPFKLQKLTHWKKNDDGSYSVVGAMSPMMAVREFWDRMKPVDSTITVTAIYRLLHSNEEIHTYAEPGNPCAVSVDILVAVLDFAGVFIIADFGHKTMPVALKLSDDEPLSLTELYKCYPWIKRADVSEFEQALASIDLDALRKQSQQEIQEITS